MSKYAGAKRRQQVVMIRDPSAVKMHKTTVMGKKKINKMTPVRETKGREEHHLPLQNIRLHSGLLFSLSCTVS